MKLAPGLRNRARVDLQVDNFNEGTNVLLSETRLKKNEAKTSTNMMLIEDGVWTKRWGTMSYGGVSFTNTPDGFREYKKSDGTRELIVVADGVAYVVDPDAGTKTAISGATFTQGYQCDFLQINDLLYIVNGIDPIARYNGTDFDTYSALSTPTWDGTPLARGGGLSAGSYTYYYRVTAMNDVGETLGAAEQSITVNIDRNEWDAANEIITLAFGDVSGATKYGIYFSDTSGYEVKLAETTASTYVDDGSAVPNPYIEPPLANTTAGPLFTSICLSGNRIWGTGDLTNKQIVYFTGTGANLGNFAPGYGGGWVNLEKGGRSQTTTVVDYQGTAHVLMHTDDGKGDIWQVPLNSVTVGSETIIVPTPSKIIPSVGTSSIRGVVYVENDIMFPNSAGWNVLGNEPGVLDILRTNELSPKIRPYWRALYHALGNQICAYYYDAKVFISVPSGNGDNDRIVVFDRERTAWVKDWSIGVMQFGEFTDSDGITHLLGISGTGLIEFSENFESDDGTAFTWQYISPRFSVAEDWTKFANIEEAFARVRNARGAPDISISGTGEEGVFGSIGSATIDAGFSDSGIGWDQLGTVQLGDTEGVPTFFSEESLIRFLDIDEYIRDIQYTISGDAIADKATITGLKVVGKLVNVDRPEDWRLD